MAAKKPTGRRVDGWKAKSWYKIYSPDNVGKVYLGDTVADDPEKIIGRTIQVPLSELVNDYSKQNVKMKFEITNVAGDAAYTSFIGHELARDFIRSMVKRRTSRIDCVVNFISKDGWKIRTIVTCFTLTRADQSQQHEIRRILTNDVLNYGKENELGVFINNIINGDLAKELFKQVKELHPVRRVEVIKTKVELPKSSS
ncbi:30S ribosomal protein S3ae [Methanospirillum sp.]|uniref:30S ribosomal protein S3ae n=1 Tax=Methanospirillum sp. TaxID=45200 RepID=UPI002987721C|nr:30S ribosomal protein S3ae [Methanospirillum sp.]